jgi:hypothetical protein
MDHPNIVPLLGYTSRSEIFGLFGSFISPVSELRIIGKSFDAGWQWYPNGDAATFLALHGEDMNMDERKKLVSGIHPSGSGSDPIAVARNSGGCLLPS